MTPSVTLIGNGRLAACIQEEWNLPNDLLYMSSWQENWTQETDLLILADDHWNPRLHLQAEKAARENHIPWVRSFFSFGEGIIGPFVQPERKGCSQCADYRRRMASNHRRDLSSIQHFLVETGRTTEECPDPFRIRSMAIMLKEEVRAWAEDRPLRTTDHIALFSTQTMKRSLHYVLPDSNCFVCGTVPVDDRENAKIDIQSNRKISSTTFRTKTMEELSRSLSNDYLDTQTGLLNSRMIELDTPFSDVIVNLPLPHADEGSAGRTNSFQMSENTAILEGLERFCGTDPKGKRTTVYDCFQNLPSAVHPFSLGVHAAEDYETENHPFTPFDPERKTNWVWGYSFLRKEPVLVPERLAYYSTGCGDGFVFETSNGCAIGGSREEAIFYGIMEVLERDSFLLSWYARLPLKRIDPSTIPDQELQWMLLRLEEISGYDLHLYDATMEHGIPSVFTIIKNRNQKEERLNLLCAGGAHLDPIKAIKGALFESAGMIEPLNKIFRRNKASYMPMLHDDALVRSMDDHGMLYGLKEAEKRLDFLLQQKLPGHTFSECYSPPPRREDLKEDLMDVLQRLHLNDLDVIVVDQTTEEIRKNGLHCVKVIIPGALPMTFGHHLRRITGLKRVLEVPKALGYKGRKLRLEELNPHPHPFP
ncbi:UNVERIFIED_CONTAM: TOMM precursor leader peptide-binding protein [Halobacillus marinus]